MLLCMRALSSTFTVIGGALTLSHTKSLAPRFFDSLGHFFANVKILQDHGARQAETPPLPPYIALQ